MRHCAPTVRPSIYTAELADRILDELMEGRLLIDICDDPGMLSTRTIRLWAQVDREGFAARYDRAQEIDLNAMADQMLAIADDGRNDWIVYRRKDGAAEVILDHEHVSGSRLRVNARRWVLTKMLPRLYGDRPDGITKPEVDNGWAASNRSRQDPTKSESTTGRGGLRRTAQRVLEVTAAVVVLASGRDRLEEMLGEMDVLPDVLEPRGGRSLN
jgi:hypothetical protein